MDFGFSPQEEQFRSEVLDLLDKFRGVDGYFHRGVDAWKAVQQVYRELGERGWLSL